MNDLFHLLKKMAMFHIETCELTSQIQLISLVAKQPLLTGTSVVRGEGAPPIVVNSHRDPEKI